MKCCHLAAFVRQDLRLVGTALAVVPDRCHEKGSHEGRLELGDETEGGLFMNASPRRSESGTIRRGRVLVVSDEAREGKELAAILLEHSVVPVSTGADALTVIAAGFPYDLLLCDVMLHDMSGVELLSRLWRDHPDQAQRLVFIARVQVSPVLQYLLDGVPNLCIDVPFDIEGLRALIERRIRAPSSRVPQRA
jgi:CheY-like chemotaxis protein